LIAGALTVSVVADLSTRPHPAPTILFILFILFIHVHSQATLFATGPTHDQAASDVRPNEVLNTRSRAISAVNPADGINMDRQDGQD
jgi:hypothetical protein